eukprot:364229-Chlamydomonas_euryale.AAC.6
MTTPATSGPKAIYAPKDFVNFGEGEQGNDLVMHDNMHQHPVSRCSKTALAGKLQHGTLYAMYSYASLHLPARTVRKACRILLGCILLTARVLRHTCTLVQSWHWNEKRVIAQFYSDLSKREAREESERHAMIQEKFKELEAELMK